MAPVFWHILMWWLIGSVACLTLYGAIVYVADAERRELLDHMRSEDESRALAENRARRVAS